MNQTIDQTKVAVFIDEYKYIRNQKYRDSIKILVSKLPDYFFEVPASSTGKYHPSYALGKGGLVRHTKAAAKIAFDLLQNEAMGNIFTSDEKDQMIMAILLHDGLKSGVFKEQYTRFDHPILAADFVKEHGKSANLTSDETETIARVIESHMGPWNTATYSDVVLPKPSDRYQKFVHMCDYLASRKYLEVTFQNDQIIG